jgi:hypothetical protein
MIVIAVQIISAQLENAGDANGNPSAYRRLSNNKESSKALASQRSRYSTKFVCTSDSTFISYDRVNGKENHSCPTGSFCNKKCVNPCTTDIRYC